ncbi:MAG: GGDEF domain-containing protein [Sciscionella sp.]|nr:GGDEF domain-containing protein [Sciscionella sp.]
MLAAHGEWRQAYRHLRSALDLLYTDGTSPTPQWGIPEQLRREVDRLRRAHAEVQELSIRDSLTASYNRRYLDQRLTHLFADPTYNTTGVAVALVDLDWFKKVNDRFGHLVGDRVLQRVVELLQQGLPADAFCARYGGEEFVLALPGVDAQRSVAITEAMRERIERHAWSTITEGLRITVSIGLAHHRVAHPDEVSPIETERQLLRADSLLYTAKQSGRNSVAYVGQSGRPRLAGAAANRRMVAE